MDEELECPISSRSLAKKRHSIINVDLYNHYSSKYIAPFFITPSTFVPIVQLHDYDTTQPVWRQKLDDTRGEGSEPWSHGTGDSRPMAAQDQGQLMLD